MKQLILDNKFTTNSNNRNTHWDSSFNGRKYRSAWEALYHCHDPYAEYEKLRLAYYFDGKKYIYIVDFVNHTTLTAIEVKPIELCNDSKTIAKINALKAWCNTNNYSFLLVDKDYLLTLQKPTNMLLFDNKTKEKLYETNKKNNN